MPSAARMLLRHAERQGWHMVIDTGLAMSSAIATWKVVKVADDDVHVVFFDHNRRLGSALLSAGDVRLLGYTQHGLIAAIADRIIDSIAATDDCDRQARRICCRSEQ